MVPRGSTSSSRGVLLAYMDPVTACRDAEIAANTAYNRSRAQTHGHEGSAAGPASKSTTSDQSGSREIRKSQSIRFVGPCSATAVRSSGSGAVGDHSDLSTMARQRAVHSVENISAAPESRSGSVCKPKTDEFSHCHKAIPDLRGQASASRGSPAQPLEGTLVTQKENIQPGTPLIRATQSVSFLRGRARRQQLPDQSRTSLTPESNGPPPLMTKSSVIRFRNGKGIKAAQHATDGSRLLPPPDVGPAVRPLTEKTVNQVGPGLAMAKDPGLKERARQVSQSFKTRFMTLFKNKQEASAVQIPHQHVQSTRRRGKITPAVGQPVVESLRSSLSDEGPFATSGEHPRPDSWTSKVLPQIPLVHGISTEGIIPEPPVNARSVQSEETISPPEKGPDSDQGKGSSPAELIKSVSYVTFNPELKRLPVVNETGAYAQPSETQSTVSRTNDEIPSSSGPLPGNGDRELAWQEDKKQFSEVLRQKSLQEFCIAGCISPRLSSSSPPLGSDNDRTPRVGRFAFRDDDSSKHGTPTPTRSTGCRLLKTSQAETEATWPLETNAGRESRFHETDITGSKEKSSAVHPVAAISPKYLEPHGAIADRPSTFFGSPTTYTFRTQSPYRAQLRARMELESRGKSKEEAVHYPSPSASSESMNERIDSIRPNSSHSVAYSESIYTTAISSRHGTPAPQASIDGLILSKTVDSMANNEACSGASQRSLERNSQLISSPSDSSLMQVAHHDRTRRSTLDLVESFPIPPTNLGNVTIKSSTAYITSFRADCPGHRVSSSCSSFDWKTWLSADVAKFGSPPKLRLSPVPPSPSDKTGVELHCDVNAARKTFNESSATAFTIRDDERGVEEDVYNASPRKPTNRYASDSKAKGAASCQAEVAGLSSRLERGVGAVLSLQPLNVMERPHIKDSQRHKGKENEGPLHPPFQVPIQPATVAKRSPLRVATSASTSGLDYDENRQSSGVCVEQSVHFTKSDSSTVCHLQTDPAAARTGGISTGSMDTRGAGGFFSFRRRVKGTSGNTGSDERVTQPRPSLSQRWLHGWKTAGRIESSRVSPGNGMGGDIQIMSSPASTHMMEAVERQFGKYANTTDTSTQDCFGISIAGTSLAGGEFQSNSEESTGFGLAMATSIGDTTEHLVPIPNKSEERRASATAASLPSVPELSLPDLGTSGPNDPRLATSGKTVNETTNSGPVSQGPRNEDKVRSVQEPTTTSYTYTPRGDYVYTTAPAPGCSVLNGTNSSHSGIPDQESSANTSHGASGPCQSNYPFRPANSIPRSLVQSPIHGTPARHEPTVSIQTTRPSTPRPPTPRPTRPVLAATPISVPHDSIIRRPGEGSSSGTVRFAALPDLARMIPGSAASGQSLTDNASHATPPHPTRPAPPPPPPPLGSVHVSTNITGSESLVDSPHSDSLSSQYNAYPVSSPGSFDSNSTPKGQHHKGAAGHRGRGQQAVLVRSPSCDRMGSPRQMMGTRRCRSGRHGTSSPSAPRHSEICSRSASSNSGSSSGNFQREAMHGLRGSGDVHRCRHPLACGSCDSPSAYPPQQSSACALASDEEEDAVREYHLARRQRIIARNAARASSSAGGSGSRHQSSTLYAAGASVANARRRKKISARKRRSAVSQKSTSSSDPYT